MSSDVFSKRNNSRVMCAILAAVTAVGIFTAAAINPQKAEALSQKNDFIKTATSAKPAAKLTAKKSGYGAVRTRKMTIRSFKGCVFMGDSVTEDMLNYDATDNSTVVASIGASSYDALTCHKVIINDNKSDVAYMPDRVAAAHPRRIYMMFGSNDLCLGNDMPLKSFIGYYHRLIDVLHSRCPHAKIYVESILPITKAVQNTKEYPFDNKKITVFNKALKRMCRHLGLKYMDVASVIKGTDGNLPSNESDDGLHLRSDEYKKWFSYLSVNS